MRHMSGDSMIMDYEHALVGAHSKPMMPPIGPGMLPMGSQEPLMRRCGATTK